MTKVLELFLLFSTFVLSLDAQGIQQQIDAVAARGGGVVNVLVENCTAKNVTRADVVEHAEDVKVLP